MREPEAVKIAKLLEKAGCDGIEVSCGVAKDGFSTVRMPEPPVDAITGTHPSQGKILGREIYHIHCRTLQNHFIYASL
jgi:hypothetical protein